MASQAVRPTPAGRRRRQDPPLAAADARAAEPADVPSGVWVRATYLPEGTSALTQDQRLRVGLRAVYRLLDDGRTLACPAGHRSFVRVGVDDLTDLEALDDDEGFAEWRADMQAADGAGRA